MLLALATLAVIAATPCAGQMGPPARDFNLPGGISGRVPMDWMMPNRPAESGATDNGPRTIFVARSMMMSGSRDGGLAGLTISQWTSGSGGPLDPQAGATEAGATLPVRQALAMEGFTINQAWTASSDAGGAHIVASTFVGTFGQGMPWVVETTTFQTRDTVYAAQLRYPSTGSPMFTKAVADVKSALHFNGTGTAFASGYVATNNVATVSPQHPEMPGRPPQVPAANFPPAAPVAPQIPVAPPSTTTVSQEQVSTILRNDSASLVLVEGKEKSGSGFVCNLGGQKFLVTNTHVVSGNAGVNLRALDRAPIQVAAASAAVGHDLTRFVVTSATPALDTLDNLGASLSVGDDVLVLGNAEGAAVVNPIAGHVVGLGPNLVEVDAPFVPGNSGSPIIQVKSGKVVGVATYAITRELQTLAGTREQKVRRFGYRLDSVTTWQPINWTKFNAEAAGIQQAEELTQDLVRLWKGIAAQDNRAFNTAQNPALRRAEDEYEEVFRSGSRASSADILRAKQSFLSSVRSICTTDLSTLRPTLTYDYFQRAASDELEIRNQFSKVFDELFRSQKEDSNNRRGGSSAR